MIKPSKVVFIEEKLEKAFYSLSDNDPLKKFLKRAIRDLKQNAFCGIQIPKRLIPREYLSKYNLKNLWKYDLPKGWRLIYTITAKNEIELITAVLEWFNHKNYEKRMKY
jgi:Txe/YoeB family toxin of Txe-Axe toxin-antitoxin module